MAIIATNASPTFNSFKVQMRLKVTVMKGLFSVLLPIPFWKYVTRAAAPSQNSTDSGSTINTFKDNALVSHMTIVNEILVVLTNGGTLKYSKRDVFGH